MLRAVLVVSLLFVSIAVALPAHAGPLSAEDFYISESNGEISRVNTSTGANSLVLSTGKTWFDIAWSPSGTLYGIESGRLWTIDLTSGTLSLVGAAGVGGNFNSLEFASDGTLYSANSNTGGLYTLNTGTGAASLVGAIGQNSSGDLAFDTDGTLYMTSTSNNLIRIDAGTGAGVVVGAIGFSEVYGIDFVDGTLIGATSGSKLIAIDTTTGAGSFIANLTPGASAFGASTAPSTVPEPGTIMLLGLGLAGATLGRRRKKSSAA